MRAPEGTDIALIAEWQNELHNLLNAVVNGYHLSRLERWFTTRRMGNKRRYANSERVRDLTRQVQGVLYGNASASIPEPVLELVAEGYELLAEVAPLAPSVRTEQVVANGTFDAEVVERHPDRRFLMPVLQLAKRARAMGDLCVEFLLHGSLGTMDYVKGFSDVDTLAVLRRSTATSVVALREMQLHVRQMQSCMYQVDPLQHHGVFVIAEQDLDWYPDTYLPCAVWHVSQSLLTANPHRVRVRANGSECVEALKGVCRWFDAKIGEGLHERNLYEAKLCIAFVLLAPALYLQVLGMPMYKRESFAAFRRVYDGDVTAVDLASEARRSWFLPVDAVPVGCGRLTVPPVVVRKWGMRRMRRVVRLRQPALDEVLQRGARLVHELLDRLAV